MEYVMQPKKVGRRSLFAALGSSIMATTIEQARGDAAAIRIGYAHWIAARPTISLLDRPSRDEGLAGAKMALEDNNTTGRFMNQQFELTEHQVRPG